MKYGELCALGSVDSAELLSAPGMDGAALLLQERSGGIYVDLFFFVLFFFSSDRYAPRYAPSSLIIIFFFFIRTKSFHIVKVSSTKVSHDVVAQVFFLLI